MSRWYALVALALVSCSGAEPEGDPTGVVSQRWTAEPCGKVLGSYDGTDAKSNGTNTGTGYSCGGTGTYGLQYQCVELVMRHFKTHWNLRWYGNAKDLLAHAKSASYFQTGSPSDVEVWSNGDAAHPPKAGDMIVWTSGTYGHVALITRVTSTAIDILEQNVSGVTPQGKYTLKYDGKTVAGRWGAAGPAGWIHAKKNTSTGVVDAGGPADTGTTIKDSGAPSTPDAEPIADSGTTVDDDGGSPPPIDETGEPEGVGDPIVAPPNDPAAAADDTALQGSCAYGDRTDASPLPIVALALLAAVRARRRAAVGSSPRR